MATAAVTPRRIRSVVHSCTRRFAGPGTPADHNATPDEPIRLVLVGRTR